MELSVQNITKTYRRGKKRALDGFSSTLTPGVYGLLGPNGAGKSTLMNIITGNLAPDSGAVLWDGAETRRLGRQYRSLLGYMPQHQGVYDDFTANRFLWYMAALKGLDRKTASRRIAEVLDLVNLRDEAHKKLGAYSGGMKQRILIAQALLNDPQLLILDEPTAGLDPRERIRVRNFISRISRDKVVLLATHVVSDVECICKEVLLLRAGELIRKDTTPNLIGELEGKVWLASVAGDDMDRVFESYPVSNLSVLPDGMTGARIVSETRPPFAVCEPVRPNLEDVYLYHFSDDEGRGGPV